MAYKIVEFNIRNSKDIKRIYLDSFDKENRFSFINLLTNIVLKRANIYVVITENETIGFLYSIHYKKERFILYLAIKENYRDKGIGSLLLNWYSNKNKDENVYLNIDEVDEKYEDFAIRKKRLEFYLKNNFYNTNYVSTNGNSVGNILSNKKEFDREKYKLFDKKISKWFFCKKDKVKKAQYKLK